MRNGVLIFNIKRGSFNKRLSGTQLPANRYRHAMGLNRLDFIRADAGPLAHPDTAVSPFVRLPAILSLSSFQAAIFKIIGVVNHAPIIAGSAVNIRIGFSVVLLTYL